MKENIWALIEWVIEDTPFEVKAGNIEITGMSSVCILAVSKIGLKDGFYVIEGKGTKAKPVKSFNPPPYPVTLPELSFSTKAKLGTTENIYKVLSQINGGVVKLIANGESLKINQSLTHSQITAIIPIIKIDGDNCIALYSATYLLPLFRYTTPTSLSFGENYPLLLVGENWQYFLAPRKDEG
jgi:hypothetical protein